MNRKPFRFRRGWIAQKWENQISIQVSMQRWPEAAAPWCTIPNVLVLIIKSMFAQFFMVKLPCWMIKTKQSWLLKHVQNILWNFIFNSKITHVWAKLLQKTSIFPWSNGHVDPFSPVAAQVQRFLQMPRWSSPWSAVAMVDLGGHAAANFEVIQHSYFMGDIWWWWLLWLLLHVITIFLLMILIMIVIFKMFVMIAKEYVQKNGC